MHLILRREEFGIPVGRRFRAPEDLDGYVLRDPLGVKVGTVEEVFSNASGGPEYVRVNVGGVFFRRSVLLPVEDLAVDEGRSSLVLN